MRVRLSCKPISALFGWLANPFPFYKYIKSKGETICIQNNKNGLQKFVIWLRYQSIVRVEVDLDLDLHLELNADGVSALSTARDVGHERDPIIRVCRACASRRVCAAAIPCAHLALYSALFPHSPAPQWHRRTWIHTRDWRSCPASKTLR